MFVFLSVFNGIETFLAVAQHYYHPALRECNSNKGCQIMGELWKHHREGSREGGMGTQ